MIDLRLGDCLTVLRSLESESVHCVVTSPPYWGLRSYGTDPQVWQNGHEPCIEHTWITETRNGQSGGQSDKQDSNRGSRFNNLKVDTCSICGAVKCELGLEPTPELYVEHITQIFREVKRVLRDDGTLWLNLGDSYAGSWGNNGAREGKQREANQPKYERHAWDEYTQRPPMSHRLPGLKPKDLVGIPWMVAFALRADGWYLRSDCIWHKPNPMPESVTDRPTKAHEYLFLLSKSQRYYYDADAVREENQGGIPWGALKNKKKICNNAAQGEHGKTSMHNPMDHESVLKYSTSGRNRRTVWTVATHPFKGAHFATFPPKLIEPCILAGTSARGVCPKCGAPWERVTERGEPDKETTRGKQNWTAVTGQRDSAGGLPHRDITTIGWRPTCSCDAGEPVPATVLDLFNGAGTTGVVAVTHGRNYIGIDLKSEYIEMARERIEKVQPALVTV